MALLPDRRRVARRVAARRAAARRLRAPAPLVRAGRPGRPPSASGGTFAHTLAGYLEKQTPGVPCPVVGVGQELKIDDWTIRVDSVSVNEAESRLPWIKNVDERSAFGRKDRKGLVVQYSVRNDTPIKKPRDLWIEVHTSDGEVPTGGA